MGTTTNGWTIHDERAGVLSYSYAFNKRGGNATTWATKIPGGGLLVISPGAKMPDVAFDTLKRYGDVRVVVANNGYHHLGLGEWAKRFPGATFHAPKRAATRIAQKSATAPRLKSLAEIGEQLGDHVYLREAPQNKNGEVWAWVEGSRTNHWFGSDMFCNWQTFPGNFLLNAAWKYTKSGPGFSLFHLAMKGTLHDKAPALKTMLRDLEDFPPATLVMSHGHPLTHAGIGEEATRLIRSELTG